MSHKSSGKDPKLVQKLSQLKEKQEKWMQEREVNKTSNKFVHSSLKSSASASKQKIKKSQQEEPKKTEALLWTANNANYNGFVVRNGSASARSKQDSVRMPVNKKSYTHSSLKKQTSSRPVSAKSANFVSSKQTFAKNLEDESEEILDTSDESLSTSFTDHISNLNFNDAYISGNATNGSSPKLFIEQKNTYMSNHFCCICKQVMVTENRKPQIVFPCGHSFCTQCINGKVKCPDCNCEIISTQENDSLFTVIQQFKRKTEKEELEQKEKQIRKYIEEYKNLNTRISIMKGEATDIIDDMEDITHKLINKQNTTKQIEENIQEIENEILDLKQQAQTQQRNLKMESNKTDALEKSYENQKGQLNMLQKTISSISENKEKVRRLVENLAPNVVPLLDDFDDD